MRFQASDGLRGGSSRPIAYYTGEKFMLACLQMKPYAVLLLACLVAGCANVGLRENRAFELQDGDFGLIAGAALEIVERLGPVRTIVVPANIDPRVRAALARRRPLVADERTPLALPAGYFRLEIFRIDDDGQAFFEGDLGPTGCPMDAGCGKNISIPFILRGDDWFNPSYKIVDYAQRREVIPVN